MGKILALIPIILCFLFSLAAHTIGVSPTLTTAYGLLAITTSSVVFFFIFRRHPFVVRTVQPIRKFISKHAVIIGVLGNMLVFVYVVHLGTIAQNQNEKQQTINTQNAIEAKHVAEVAKTASAQALQVLSIVAQNQASAHRDLAYECDFARDAQISESAKAEFRSSNDRSLAHDLASVSAAASRDLISRSVFDGYDAHELVKTAPEQCLQKYIDPTPKLKTAEKAAKQK